MSYHRVRVEAGELAFVSFSTVLMWHLYPEIPQNTKTDEPSAQLECHLRLMFRGGRVSHFYFARS